VSGKILIRFAELVGRAVDGVGFLVLDGEHVFPEVSTRVGYSWTK
jgi:hypothetical protein